MGAGCLSCFSCYLSLILKHSEEEKTRIRRRKKKQSIKLFFFWGGGGGRGVRDAPPPGYVTDLHIEGNVVLLMKSFIAKRVNSILVNLRYLRFKLLKYKENIRTFVILFIITSKYSFIYNENCIIRKVLFCIIRWRPYLKMSKLALNSFCDKTLYLFVCRFRLSILYISAFPQTIMNDSQYRHSRYHAWPVFVSCRLGLTLLQWFTL